jgi:hypothetical protein
MRAGECYEHLKILTLNLFFKFLEILFLSNILKPQCQSKSCLFFKKFNILNFKTFKILNWQMSRLLKILQLEAELVIKVSIEVEV